MSSRPYFPHDAVYDSAEAALDFSETVKAHGEEWKSEAHRRHLPRQTARRFEWSANVKANIFSKIKPGDLVIIKGSGIVGRESQPTPVIDVTKSEIITRLSKFKKSDGKEVQETRWTKNDEGQRVKEKPEPNPARILRLATPQDIAKHKAAKRAAEESRKAIEERDAAFAQIATLFPSHLRPAVSGAWSGAKSAYRLEFDGLSEETIRKLAEIIRGTFQS